jgi:predicted metal-binding membrane protein
MSAFFAPSHRERSAGVLAGLAIVTSGCWAYLFAVDSAMGSMGSPLAMPMTSAWSAGDFALMWTMWSVMMVAMMLPSATPMVAAYAQTIRSPRATLHGSTALFITGYVVLWAGFALIASLAQWALHDLALVDAMGTSTSRWLAGPVLLLAGAYQFTGLKQAMLGRCRTPLGFVLNEWRGGRVGALRMGLHHGVLCGGCCWTLMTLLFVLGVMNLWWVAVISTVVLVEKATRSPRVPQVVGAGLLACGVVVVLGLV